VTGGSFAIIVVPQRNHSMKVLVIGGGIGGLSAALSLAAAGIEVAVFEQVQKIEALGVGISLQPNAVRELVELGLGDALKAVAIETSTQTYCNRLGQAIWSEPLGLAAGYAWPQYSIDRGDLHLILLQAVEQRIGANNVFTGRSCVGFEQSAGGVTAHFADKMRGAPLPSHHGDALIGADGIHSAVRAQLYPCEGPPISNGRILWRGVIEGGPFLDGRTFVMIRSRDRHAVIYPMSERARARGRSLINWATVLGCEQASGELPTRQRKATQERFFAHFKDWNFDWIPFADLISATPEINEYPLEDRNPLPRWSFGRVTLLGDAAHPMTPIGSQAGSQAIVDARVVAMTLACEPTVEQGLLAYERIRLPAMNAVILRNREFGPSLIMERAEERAPDGLTDIEQVILRREIAEAALAFKVAAGFDPPSLNARPSYSVGRV
jgi:2-polyprenyl-6-methoxyphenol hydroxylase-like FAD-dependent oxidoreductase